MAKKGLFPPNKDAHKTSKGRGLTPWPKGGDTVRDDIMRLAKSAAEELGYHPYEVCRILNVVLETGTGKRKEMNDKTALSLTVGDIRTSLQSKKCRAEFHTGNPDVTQRHFLEPVYRAWKARGKKKRPI